MFERLALRAAGKLAKCGRDLILKRAKTQDSMSDIDAFRSPFSQIVLCTLDAGFRSRDRVAGIAKSFDKATSRHWEYLPPLGWLHNHYSKMIVEVERVNPSEEAGAVVSEYRRVVAVVEDGSPSLPPNSLLEVGGTGKVLVPILDHERLTELAINAVDSVFRNVRPVLTLSAERQRTSKLRREFLRGLGVTQEELFAEVSRRQYGKSQLHRPSGEAVRCWLMARGEGEQRTLVSIADVLSHLSGQRVTTDLLP